MTRLYFTNPRTTLTALLAVLFSIGLANAQSSPRSSTGDGPARGRAENEIILRTGNDFLAGNSRSDDLYTAGLGFTLELDRDQPATRPLGRRFLTIEENLFTDRDADRRFDETWLLFGRRLRGEAWRADVYVGAVQAGRGMFGEDTQNLVHRLIGDDEVHLRYVDRDRHFAVLGARVRRLVATGDRGELHARAEARFAPEFQNWARVAIDGTLRVRPWLDIIASLGARASHTGYEPLKPWIESVALTAELGVVLKERLVFSWTRNEFGTDLGHLNLAVRLPLRATVRAPSHPRRSTTPALP